jgi:hypothetical protein
MNGASFCNDLKLILTPVVQNRSKEKTTQLKRNMGGSRESPMFLHLRQLVRK